MAIVDDRVSVWEALAGRAPGRPVGPADPGLWTAVAERINPAKARPVLRAGIETAELVSARGVRYAMLRSPDRTGGCYLRLSPEELELVRLMDGTRTVARLVADFARIAGRLAPDQVRRVVADLAGNRMLEELPVDAFAPLRRVRRRPWPLRLGRGLLLFAQGRRVVLANIDPLVTVLYKAGGRLLFTRVAVALMAAVAAVGLAAFGYQWWTGERSVFLTSNSYALGALVLLGLNIVALASHELGHALATKHAGRRVPSAGFLVYFGIPSVFVDTTDVWMAGRRARLRTTAAGPAAGLVLAGACSLVGLAVPEAAPLCFKLSFAWYLNALFNLNPFLALDGYYLLMDWLEIPNLRARGLAWVVARVRRRPPSWSGLDREGRLVALYGLLALGWLVIAANIGYRVYVDRVGGLITGLWRSGWTARVLLVVVIAALASPLVYILAGACRRWLRLVRDRTAERRLVADEPRRLAALRDSTLRDLPEPALRSLASVARWRHPRTGEQLVLAGAAQPYVFAVVDGALEARAPADPAGTVRERVGAGGVVGLAPALTGAPPVLSWHTAGTTLLQLPATAVATAIGPVAAGSFGVAGEAEQLFAEAPGLAGLSAEDRLGLAAAAVPVQLAPGGPVTLAGSDTALVIASGVLATPDGEELGRGTLIGPVGEDFNGQVAIARTAVRALRIPAVSGLPLLLGASAGALAAEFAGRSPGRAPVTGVHPPAAYPPLSPPPGPPPPTADDGADRRFEKWLRRLLILVLLLALLFTGGNAVLAGKAWGEMPTDKALVHVTDGTATVVVSGRSWTLGRGEDIYVGATDTVTVDPLSQAQMTFRGGGSALLCARTSLRVGPLSSTGSRAASPVGGARVITSPAGAFDLDRGLTIVDTATTSSAFRDLALSIGTAQGTVHNVGAATYAVASRSALAATGSVFLGSQRLTPTGGALDCGDGTSPTPVITPTRTSTPTPTPTLTPSPSATPSPTAPATATSSSTSTPPTSSSSSGGTPADQPPSIRWQTDPNRQTIDQVLPTGAACSGGQTTVTLSVTDNGYAGPNQVTHVVFQADSIGYYHDQQVGGPDWYSSTPPVNFPHTPGSVTLQVTAYDAQGQASATLQSTIIVAACTPPAQISNIRVRSGTIAQLYGQAACTQYPLTTDILVDVTGAVSVAANYVISADGTSGGLPTPIVNGNTYTFTLGPIGYLLKHGQGGPVVVTITAYNSAKQPTSVTTTIQLSSCFPIG